MPEVERETGGRVSVSGLVNMKKTLDVGCGIGAYARAMRELGSRGKFVGVDPTKYSTGDDAYGEYEDLIFKDIQSIEALERLGKHHFDCVISVGLPPQALDFVARNKAKFNLTQGGLMVLVTDSNIRDNQYKEFDVDHGIMVVDESILVSK